MKPRRRPNVPESTIPWAVSERAKGRGWKSIAAETPWSYSTLRTYVLWRQGAEAAPGAPILSPLVDAFLGRSV